MANKINSFVELVTAGSNKECLIMNKNFSKEDFSSKEEFFAFKKADMANLKAAQAGDEAAAEAFVRSHSVVITDLNGNVEFDLMDRMAFSMPNLKVFEEKYSAKISGMKNLVNSYFYEFFKFEKGEITKEKFNDNVTRILHR